MWDLSQNDGPTANVLMHIIIYSTLYEKKEEKKKRIYIRIGSAGLYIYFGIRATVKLLEKKWVLHNVSDILFIHENIFIDLLHRLILLCIWRSNSQSSSLTISL